MRKIVRDDLSLFIPGLILLLYSCSKDSAIDQDQSPEQTGIITSESICGFNYYPADTFYFHKYETDASGYQLLEIYCEIDSKGSGLNWQCNVADEIDPVGIKTKLIFHPDSVEEGETKEISVILNYTDTQNKPVQLSKNIFLKKLPVPWLGTFTGYNVDNPADTFSIEFTRTDQYGGGPACCISYTVKNLPKGINSFVQIPNLQTSYNISFNNECDTSIEFAEVLGYNLSAPKGFGKFENNNLTIDYYYKTPMPDTATSIIIRKKFVGIKN